MATNIAISLTFTVSKGILSIPKKATANVTMNGNTYFAQGVSVPTTPTPIAIEGVTTAGYALFINTDSVNAVQIGLDSSDEYVSNYSPMITLLAGECALLRLATNNIYAQSINAPVVLDITILSN